ncbi:MAG: PAS domain-containing protein [Bryobacteraceae bacterium]|nr:PAS domain-containing protein [Bryobacteraceae bacterium]
MQLASRVSQLGIWDWDVKAGVVYYSPEFTEQLGYTPEEFGATLDSWESRLHPEDKPKVALLMEDVHGGVSTEFEIDYRLLHRDGKYRWFSERTRLFRDASGDPLRAIGSLRQITPRKTAEAELEQIRKRLESAEIASGFGTWYQDVATGQVVWSPGMYRIHDMEAGTPVKLDDYFSWILPEDQPLLEAATRQIEEHGEVLWEYRVRRADENPRTLRCFAMAERDATGKVIRTFGTIFDITEERQAAQRLRRDREMLKTMVDHMPLMACLMDDSGRVLMTNRRLRDIYGYTVEDSSKRDMMELCFPDPEYRAYIRGRLREASSQPFEAKAITKNQKTLETEWRVLRLSDGTLLGLGEDVTEARKAQRQAVELERRLQDTQRRESLGLMAAGIAHDFNNLLTTIAGTASLMRQQFAHMEALQAPVARIEHATANAAELCRQMLAYAGESKTVTSKLNLSRAVEQAAPLIEATVSRRIRLRMTLDPRIPAVEANASQVRQVLLNLSINASEAIGDREGEIEISTSFRWWDEAALSETVGSSGLSPGEYACITVRDTGPGMDANTTGKIFDPFFTTKINGRGLGLASVVGIAREHRGAVHVTSAPGKGATFTVLFPQEYRHPAPKPRSDGGRVLIIDDEKSVREISAEMVSFLGLDPVVARDGHEGLAILRQAPQAFRLVLLDFAMPGIDGFQTWRELRDIRPELPVAIMTGRDVEGMVERWMEVPAPDFIQKPFAVETLQHLLKKY